MITFYRVLNLILSIMDEFVLCIDENKFRSTNEKWNELMLNDPWSVGYVSTLIETVAWKTKEEWEQYQAWIKSEGYKQRNEEYRKRLKAIFGGQNEQSTNL
jgi:hypothetical protein